MLYEVITVVLGRRADVRFLHYLRHETTGTSRADVDSKGQFRLAMTVPQTGKYHLTFKLSRQERVLGRIQVDICVGADPDSPA